MSTDPISSRASTPRSMPRQDTSSDTLVVSSSRPKSSKSAAPASGGIRRTSPRFRD